MLKEGMIVGERYEIISRIGSGGMADVYKAKDHKLNRLVAVKVMKAEFKPGQRLYFQIPQGSTGRSRSCASECGKCL